MRTALLKQKSWLVVWGLTVTVIFHSCKKEKDLPAPSEIVVQVEQDGQVLEGDQFKSLIGSAIRFNAKQSNVQTVQQAWTINGAVVSSESVFDFNVDIPGKYTITYEAEHDGVEEKQAYTVFAVIEAEAATGAYVRTLFEYLPAPGQFINVNVGNLASASGILNTNNGLVSLGAWGGSITLGFDHTVTNIANAADLRIYNNAFTNFAEPGVVWVMQDENGNGLPDDTWYEIAGSETEEQGYIRNYEVTYFKPDPATGNVVWKDNQGQTGEVKTNSAHKQSYYPEWLGESYTLSGVLLPSGNIQSGGFVTSKAFDFGYADNQAGQDDIDIDWAVDSTGKQVHLSGIDFIRIQTGILADMGGLGELSTEIKGVADIQQLE